MLKGEEVVIEKSVGDNFWFMVIMEILKCMESSSYRKKYIPEVICSWLSWKR